jgi:hypothetical protein
VAQSRKCRFYDGSLARKFCFISVFIKFPSPMYTIFVVKVFVMIQIRQFISQTTFGIFLKNHRCACIVGWHLLSTSANVCRISGLQRTGMSGAPVAAHEALWRLLSSIISILPRTSALYDMHNCGSIGTAISLRPRLACPRSIFDFAFGDRSVNIPSGPVFL